MVCQHFACLRAQRPFNNLEKVHPGWRGFKIACKRGIFFTPPKRVTSPPWGPPPLCKQVLIPELWGDNRVIVSKKLTGTIVRSFLSLKTTQTLQVEKINGLFLA